MVHSFTKRRRSLPPAIVGVLAAGLMVVGQVRAPGQDASSPAASGGEALKQSFVTPGATKPVQIYADDITTWVEGPQRVFLLKGRVWIEQGVLNLRMPQGVVWVDEDQKKKTGTYNLEVFGENVTVEDGVTHKAGATGQLQLATGSEVRIKAYANPVAQKELRTDPLYARALAKVPAMAQLIPLPKTPLAEMIRPEEKTQLTSGQPANSLPPIPLPNLPPAGDFGVVQAQFLKPVDAGGVQPVQFSGPPPGPVETPVPPAPASNPRSVPGAVPPPPPVPAPQPIPSGLSPLKGPVGEGGPKQLIVRPGSSQNIQGRNYPLPSGETAVVVTSPVILTVIEPATKKVLLDIQADRLVFWTKGNSQELFGNLRSSNGETSKSLEFYLSGNVEIRNQSKKETEIIRADEVYYDVNRHVAIALRADLEIREPKAPYPIHFKADELLQLNAKLFLAKQTQVYSTKLPSDPGLKIEVREANIEEKTIIRKTIFGTDFIDRKTGEPLKYTQRIFTGYNNVLRFEGVPVFYSPWLKGDVQDPLGPLDGVHFSYNQIFGFHILSTWDMYELLGRQPTPGTKWRLFVDGMTKRGPALGTEYTFSGTKLLDIPNRYEGFCKAYGMYDTGTDVIGGGRGTQAWVTDTITVPVTHPDWRGRILGRFNLQELPDGFSAQAQVAAISDRNFLEQFYHNEWLNDLNQETFVYLKQQNNNWAWTLLAEPHVRNWITETAWLPRADGYLIGQSIFDLFTYNLHAGAGYGRLWPTSVPSFAYSTTDQQTNAGRFDLLQELSLPMTLGAFKVVPYVKGDLTYYTSDLNGDDVGRLYGGAGIRGSIPFSRLYPDAHSELFNVNGIFHKIVLSGNYYCAQSNTPYTQLPQLDRFNDDTSDQSLRDMHPRLPTFYPANAAFLTTPLFDPQNYALRRLIDSQIDTLDSMDVLQLGLRQRWQTKRGIPGQEHVVDWMTLDLQASIFPHSQRDNFGHVIGIMEYDWVWNIGDRTALTSSGLFEPESGGPRVFNIGANINRSDSTSFYLGYRHIDPLNSRAVVASATYAFSAKYALTFSTTYDFGVHIQSNQLTITRMGTDVQVSLGLGYNSILNTVNVQFEVVPNLMRRGQGLGAFSGMSNSMLAR